MKRASSSYATYVSPGNSEGNSRKKKRGKIGISTLRYSRFAIHFEKATTKKKKKL